MKKAMAVILLTLLCFQYLLVGCAENDVYSIVDTLEDIHNLQDLSASSLSFSPNDWDPLTGHCILMEEEGLMQATFPSEHVNTKEILMVFDLDYDNAATWFLSLVHEMLSELGQPSNLVIQPNLTDELDNEMISTILSGKIENSERKIVFLQWLPDNKKEWTLYAIDIECGVEILLYFKNHPLE